MTCVSPDGRVVLTPQIKAWMRRHRANPPAAELVWSWAYDIGRDEEAASAIVCGHCVTNHLEDVFHRYVRIFGEERKR